VYALTCRDDADVLLQSLLQIAAKAYGILVHMLIIILGTKVPIDIAD
jgi:hypothetical protein